MKARILLLFAFFLIVLPSLESIAQTFGRRLDSFHYGKGENYAFDRNRGANGTIYKHIVQPDGKILMYSIGGAYSGERVEPIYRIFSDGRLDTAFSNNVINAFNTYRRPNSSRVPEIWDFALDANGKIIISAVFFDIIPNLNSAQLFRLNSNGTFDSSFNFENQLTNWNSLVALFNKIEVLPNGKIIVATTRGLVNSRFASPVAMLNEDGSIDRSFNTVPSLRGYRFEEIHDVVLQPDGKILIAGNIDSRWREVGNVIRLNTNGSIDESFNIGAGFDGTVTSLHLMPNNKIIAAGSFFQFNNIHIRRGILRLHNDGSFDPTFNISLEQMPPANRFSVNVFKIQPYSENRLLIFGNFTRFNGMPVHSLVSIDTMGNLTNAPQFVDYELSGVHTVTQLPNTNLLISGRFETTKSISRRNIGLFNREGIPIPSFNDAIGANNQINSVTKLLNDKIIITGPFTAYNDSVRLGIACINSDGSLDNSFNPRASIGGYATDIVPISTNAFLIGGDFSHINGHPKNNIALVNRFGHLNLIFNSGAGPNGLVTTIHRFPNGKILIGGEFTSYNLIPRKGLALLNADGSLDADVTFQDFDFRRVNKIKISNDGKIYLGGQTFIYNNVENFGLIRLNSDFSLDTSFKIVGEVSWNFFVNGIDLQPDNKILIAGNLSGLFNRFTENLVRLNYDGSADTTFNCKLSTADRDIVKLQYVSPNKILLIGRFLRYSNTDYTRVFFFKENGDLDSSFKYDTQVRFSSMLNGGYLEPDGNLLLVGSLTKYDGKLAGNIIRVNTGIIPTNSEQKVWVQKAKLNVRPNPTQSIIQFELERDTKAVLYSIVGHKTASYNLNAGENSIDLSALPSGIYYLQIPNYEVQRIVKE